MTNITLKSNKSKLVEVRGDEIRLSDGRLVGGLLPGLPSIIRAEVIDLLEGHAVYDLGFSHGCREIKEIVEIFIMGMGAEL